MKTKKLVILLLALALAFTSACSKRKTVGSSQLRILMSNDLMPFEAVINQYVRENNGKQIQVDYEGITTIKNILQSNECPYDAVWLSNSIPLDMLSGGQRLSNTAFTCASPVVFGVRISKARQLGFMGEVGIGDIIGAIKQGKLSFIMPSVSQTNSGLAAYIGLLSALSGNPNVLTLEHLSNDQLYSELASLFMGVERSSGSDDYLNALIKEGAFDCMVSSEGNLVRLNRELEAQGKEPMFLLYPSDGVAIGDNPLAYIDQGNNSKLQEFLAFKSFVTSQDGKKLLADLGMRTDIGGLISPENSSIFKESWGIRGQEHISAIVFPSAGFITESLNIYQELFRKPSHTVFCLDFSGSMARSGHMQLMDAMSYILDPEEASKDFLQFTQNDKITIIVFASDAKVVASGDGSQSLELLAALESYSPNGGTYMHAGLLLALNEIDISQDGADSYSVSIVNMTDGEASSDWDSQMSLEQFYKESYGKIPILSIMFGEANASQLEPIAAYSTGKVFDGREDLKKAFQEVRGYN
ncbi:MAG: VWA domain-containing protein [Eubacteriaceae bacterium]|nr:VWA domain-containing protein [Eubacteriaceae bacterium]